LQKEKFLFAQSLLFSIRENGLQLFVAFGSTVKKTKWANFDPQIKLSCFFKKKKTQVLQKKQKQLLFFFLFFRNLHEAIRQAKNICGKQNDQTCLAKSTQKNFF